MYKSRLSLVCGLLMLLCFSNVALAQVVEPSDSFLLYPTVESVQSNNKVLVTLLQDDVPTDQVLYYIEISKQHDSWFLGIVAFQDPLRTEIVPQSNRFLINVENRFKAYQYSDSFNQMIKDLPLVFLSSDDKESLLPSEIVNSANVQSDVKYSFPWKEDDVDAENASKYYWKLNQGPHLAVPPSEDDPNKDQKMRDGIWSGLDIGPPWVSGNDGDNDGRIYLDLEVVSASEGKFDRYVIGPIYDENKKLIASAARCGLIVKDNDSNTSLRYIHIHPTDGIPDNHSVSRGDYLGEVQVGDICFKASGPHLHLDLMRDDNFINIYDKYIGGWYVKNVRNSSVSDGNHGDGWLVQYDVSGKQIGKPIYPTQKIVNLGLLGSETTSANKPIPVGDGIVECSETSCSEGIIEQDQTQESSESQGFFDWLKGVIPWPSFRVQFWKSATVSSASTSSELYACVDFTILDLQNYLFPNSNVPVQQATRKTLGLGNCRYPDHPIRIDGAPINPSLPPTVPQGPQNYGCGDQSSGIKFKDSKGNCFYMAGAGDASLPFSPNEIQVLDPNRSYDIHLCNGGGQCDEFNNSGNIDFSSVQRPFVRAEVKIQGLVSNSTVAKCWTRTGKEVKFGELKPGEQYYTDRSYKIKNISKDELVDMRFLRTPNDDKANADPEYITCDIKKDVQVIIGFDGRATKVPSWIKDKYTHMNEEIGTTDDDMEHFDLYKCHHRGGFQLRLGGPKSQGASGVKSNYIVIFREVSGDVGDCTAKFNVPPDVPVLNSLETAILETPPFLSWSMSDRNIHDDFLQAKVNIWKDGLLQEPEIWLPQGVTQWMPIWSDEGAYSTQVIVRDSHGEMVSSNQLAYTIQKQEPVVEVPVITNLQILSVIPPTQDSLGFSAVIQNMNGTGQLTTTVHFYEHPGNWNKFSEMQVVLSDTMPTTITFGVDHHYNDFEIVIDPANEFVEANESDNSLYVPSAFVLNGFEPRYVFIGDLVVISQTGQILLEPSANPNQGMVTYVSKDYSSNKVFRAPFGFEKVNGTNYQAEVNKLFALGCITGCSSVVLNIIDSHGDIQSQTIEKPFVLPQMLVYDGQNTNCENPAEYSGVDNPDLWRKLTDAGPTACGWVREADYPIIVQVPSQHRIDTPVGKFCQGDHSVTIATLWKLELAENACDPYVGWIQTGARSSDQNPQTFSFQVWENEVADFWGDTLELNGKPLNKWTVYRLGPGNYTIKNWTWGTVLIGKDEGENKNHHSWQANSNSLEFHGIWVSMDLRGQNDNSQIVVVTDPNQTNQLAGSADLRAFVDIGDYMIILLEFPISETVSLRFASDWIAGVYLSRNVIESTNLTGFFSVYVPDARYQEFASLRPIIFRDVDDWSHEVMLGANTSDTVAQWILRNYQVRPKDLMFIKIKKEQPAGSSVFASWSWGGSIDPQDQPSVVDTTLRLFLPFIAR